MELVAKTVINLLNVAVEERCLGFLGDGVRGLSRSFDAEESDLEGIVLSTDCAEVRFGRVPDVVEDIRTMTPSPDFTAISLST